MATDPSWEMGLDFLEGERRSLEIQASESEQGKCSIRTEKMSLSHYYK